MDSANSELSTLALPCPMRREVTEKFACFLSPVCSRTDMVVPDSMPSAEPQSTLPATARWFVTTHWSVVLAAGDSSAPGTREALEKLCRAYWYPLYAYVRRQGQSIDDAQDLTQEFFRRLLEKDYLALADRERGRFRTFLLTA